MTIRWIYQIPLIKMNGDDLDFQTSTLPRTQLKCHAGSDINTNNMFVNVSSRNECPSKVILQGADDGPCHITLRNRFPALTDFHDGQDDSSITAQNDMNDTAVMKCTDRFELSCLKKDEVNSPEFIH